MHAMGVHDGLSMASTKFNQAIDFQIQIAWTSVFENI